MSADSSGGEVGPVGERCRRRPWRSPGSSSRPPAGSRRRSARTSPRP